MPTFAEIAPNAHIHLAGAPIGVGFDHQLTQNTSAFGGIDAAYYTDKTRSVIGRAGLKVTF